MPGPGRLVPSIAVSRWRDLLKAPSFHIRPLQHRVWKCSSGKIQSQSVASNEVVMRKNRLGSFLNGSGLAESKIRGISGPRESSKLVPLAPDHTFLFFLISAVMTDQAKRKSKSS
jgi:hypothetical protein